MKISALFYFVFTLLISLKSIAQETKNNKYQERLEEANELIENSNYNQALEIYLGLLEDNSSDTTAIIKLAEINFKLHRLREAMKWYEQILHRPVGQGTAIDPIHFYNYAELLLMEERIEDATYWYEMYGVARPTDSRISRKIEGIRTINELKNSPPLYRHEPVSFNSDHDDFSPAFYNNGLVFVSGRKESIENKEAKDSEYLDLYFAGRDESAEFQKPVKFSERINTNLHEGPVVFYNNNHQMIFTRNIITRQKSSEESIVLHLQLFSSQKDSTDVDWQNPKPLSINNKNYSTGHPAINSTGTLLYFSSNIPGGQGGTDLYVSEIINGNWSNPKNLGDIINTEGNEMFPFIYQDSVLYFASDGHPGLGGLDIYKVSLNSSPVKNMGHPINSSRDDFGLIIDGDVGYFSTSRNSNGDTKNDDIYRINSLITKAPDTQLVTIKPEPTFHEEIYYTVQILALRNSKTVSRKFLRDLKGVLKHDGKDGFYRYTYGRYNTPEEANDILLKVKSKGYDDAFIRREKTYIDLSKREGMEVDALYKDVSKK